MKNYRNDTECRVPRVLGVLLVACLAVSGGAHAVGITEIPFTDITSDAAATNIVIDDFLPNSSEVNGQDIGPIPNDAFTSQGVGLVSTGVYGDWTSSQVTSDFVAGGTGGTRPEIEWTFMDPNAPFQDAMVQKIGFYYGSVSDIVTVSFFDREGILLGTSTLAKTVYPEAVAFDAGSSIIHSITFDQSGTDIWLIGSFTLDPQTTTDIGFTNFTVYNPPQNNNYTPEPPTIAIMGLGLLVLTRKRGFLAPKMSNR